MFGLIIRYLSCKYLCSVFIMTDEARTVGHCWRCMKLLVSPAFLLLSSIWIVLSLCQVILILQEFPPPLKNHLWLAFESLRAADPPLKRQEGALQLLRHEPKQNGCPCNLFHILLRCQEQQFPWRYLLAEAVRHHVPSLCVLAVCFQVQQVL